MYTDEQLKSLTMSLREYAKKIKNKNPGYTSSMVNGTQIIQVAPGSGLTIGLGKDGNINIATDDVTETPDTPHQEIMRLVRTIESLQYCSLIFDITLETEDSPAYTLLKMPLEELQALTPEPESLQEAIKQWRAANGI